MEISEQDLETLCQLYEVYGAITEAKNKQVQKMGLDNYPRAESIIERVEILRKKTGLDYGKMGIRKEIK